MLGGLLERFLLDLMKLLDDYHHENGDWHDDDDDHEIHDPVVEISCSEEIFLPCFYDETLEKYNGFTVF